MSAEAAIVSSLPGRYATALFELAREAKAIDTIAKDAAQLRGMLEESADFRQLLSSPRLAREAQKKAVLALAAKAEFHTLVQNFLGVLAQGRRLAQLPAILKAFSQLVAAHRGEVTAEVVAAAPLDDAQIKDIKKQLKTALKADVQVDVRVDESLLGGLIVKVGSKQVDSSIKTKLNRLTVAMKGAG